MEINQYIVPYINQPLADYADNQYIIQDTNQLQADYADNLHPGYKFLPSDSELIVYYLKPMIATGTHPPCRIHEVNLYHYHPQKLAETYRACENKWYFLTSRERKYRNGSRPKRSAKEFGTWKATQKHTIVYDDVNRQIVGYKTSLAFFDEKGHKTAWLMHEYTTDDPNLPFGSGINGCELNKYVLCKVYKKETSRNRDHHDQAEEIRNVRSRQEDVQMEVSLPVNHGSIIDQTTMNTSHHQVMQPVVTLNSIQSPVQDSYIRRQVQFSFGAAAPIPESYIDDYTTVVLNPSPVTSKDACQPQSLENLLEDLKDLLNVQSGSNQPSMVTQDATDHIPQPPDHNARGFSIDLSDCMTLDDLDASEW